MRKVLSIAGATTLEIACDPLAMLITLSAMAMSTLAGALHYHQFGEPSRMAREAGLSSLLVGGLAFAVFGAVRTIRREIESGTLQMALARSVSRGGFFAAKLAGVAAATLAFFLAVWANSLVAVRGAELGARFAQGDIAKVFGPSLALGTAAMVVPLAAAALLNRFAGFRFVRTAMNLMLAVSLAGVCYRFDGSLAARQLGAAAMLVPPVLFFGAFAGAAAVRLQGNAAVALAFALAALSLPVLGAHYLPGSLAAGGSVPAGHCALAFAAAAPLVAAAVMAGTELLGGKDVA